MRRSLLAVTGCLALCGCQTGDMDSQIRPAPVSAGAATAIAGDMANRLSERLPREASPINLPDDRSEFGLALQAMLKGSGYSVVSGQKTEAKATMLSYALDGSDDGVLASLSTDGLRLARLYVVTGSGARPASPLSVMTFK